MNMKFIVSVILTALLSFASGLYLPWWSFAVIAFLIPLIINQKPYMAFLSGFAALLILWGGLAWWISSSNEHLLAHKISMLVIKSDEPLILFGLTAAIGAVIASLAALSGSLLRRLF